MSRRRDRALYRVYNLENNGRYAVFGRAREKRTSESFPQYVAFRRNFAKEKKKATIPEFAMTQLPGRIDYSARYQSPFKLIPSN